MKSTNEKNANRPRGFIGSAYLELLVQDLSDYTAAADMCRADAGWAVDPPPELVRNIAQRRERGQKTDR